MVAPSKPLWLVNSWTRELKLRFDRAARGGERVVTFESDLLIQLDEKRLPKGVTCTSTDSAKQQYSFHFGFKAAPIVSFYISARKAENSTSVLSVAVEGGPERHSFDLRINTHNPTGWLDWAFLARSALRELPRPWRYTTLAVTLLLLIIAPPWFWKNAPVLGVRAGILSDLTTAPFVDDFSHGAGQWRLSGDCAGIPSKTDNLGVPQRTFLRLSSPCFAVARLQSSIEGFHPLSRDPSAADFTATLGIQFRWKDDSGITRVAHEATILLHAERAYPWLAPILGEKVRGDRLTIKVLPQPPDNSEPKRLLITFNCSSACPEGSYGELTSSQRAPVSGITVIVRSSAGKYSVQVFESAPYKFDGEDPASTGREFPASTLVGGLGFIATENDEYHVVAAGMVPQ